MVHSTALNSSDNLHPIQSSQLRWCLLVVWAEGRILLQACILGPPNDWRRRIGRPRQSWLRTVEADLRPMNLRLATSKRRAQDRSAWRKLVTTATSIRQAPEEEKEEANRLSVKKVKYIAVRWSILSLQNRYSPCSLDPCHWLPHTGALTRKPSQGTKLYCLGNKGTLVWTACPRSLPDNAATGSWTRDLSITSPTR